MKRKYPLKKLQCVSLLFLFSSCLYWISLPHSGHVHPHISLDARIEHPLPCTETEERCKNWPSGVVAHVGAFLWGGSRPTAFCGPDSPFLDVASILCWTTSSKQPFCVRSHTPFCRRQPVALSLKFQMCSLVPKDWWPCLTLGLSLRVGYVALFIKVYIWLLYVQRAHYPSSVLSCHSWKWL